MARTLAQPSTDRQNRMIFTGAVALAALAAALVFASLSNFGGGSSSPAPAALGATVNVVVASQDIKAGDKITGDMLSVATLPENGVVQGAITDRAGIAGLTARYPMAKGEQFSATKLGQTDKNKGFDAVIPPGKRAVAVEITENTSVGGLIVAGNHVDVIVVLTKQSSGSGTQQQEPKAVTLLQDVEVLAVAQTTQKPVARLDKDGNPIQTDTANGVIATGPDDTDATPKAKTVTLAVNPDDAPLLALAQEEGKVWLSSAASGTGRSRTWASARCRSRDGCWSLVAGGDD